MTQEKLLLVMFLTFGALLVILLRSLLKYWYCSSKIERLRDGVALLLLVGIGATWHLMNEVEIQKQEALTRHSEPTGPPFIGWPYESAAFTVLEPSRPTANAPETVTTILRHYKKPPILVFHKDENLRAGDTVITRPDGRVFIKRLQDDRRRIAGK